MTSQQLKDKIRASCSDRGVQLYSVSPNPNAKPLTKLTLSTSKLQMLETCTAECGNDDRDVCEGGLAPPPQTSPTTVAALWNQASCQRLSPAAAEELIRRVGVRPVYSADLVLAEVDAFEGTLFSKEVPAVTRDSQGALDWGIADEVNPDPLSVTLSENPAHAPCMTHGRQCRTFVLAGQASSTLPSHPPP